jgi:hypothetical protein
VDGILTTMESVNKGADQPAAAWRTQRHRLRLECRECEVICERVVSPWHCLRSGCACVYSYEDGETTYFGCLYKVFAPELDLAAFFIAPAHTGHGSDPYGLLRVARSPRSQCRVTIEHAYASLSSRAGCCNPTFFHHPSAPASEGIRLTTRTTPESDPGDAD